MSRPDDHWSNARLFLQYASHRPTELYVKDQRIEKAGFIRRIFSEIKFFWNDDTLEELKASLKGCIIHIDKSEEKNEEYDIIKQKIQHIFRNTPKQARLFHSIKPTFTDTEKGSMNSSWFSGKDWILEKIEYASKKEAIFPDVVLRGGENRFFCPLSQRQASEVGLEKASEIKANSVFIAEYIRDKGKKFFLFRLRLSHYLQNFPFFLHLPLIRSLATSYFSKEERKDLENKVYGNKRIDQEFVAQSKGEELKVTFLGGTFCLIQYQLNGKMINIVTDPIQGEISKEQKRMIDNTPMDKLPKIDLILLSNPQKIDFSTLKHFVYDKPTIIVPWSRKSNKAYIKEAIESWGFQSDYSSEVMECRWGDKITFSYGNDVNISTNEDEKLVIHALYAQALTGRDYKKDFNLSLPLTFGIGLPTNQGVKRPFVHFVGNSAVLSQEMKDKIEKVFNGNRLVLNLQGAGPEGYNHYSYDPQPIEEAILSHLKRDCPTLAINRGVAQMTPTDTFSEGLKNKIEKITQAFQNGTFQPSVNSDLAMNEFLKVAKTIFEGKKMMSTVNNGGVETDDKSGEDVSTWFSKKMESFYIPKIYETIHVPLGVTEASV